MYPTEERVPKDIIGTMATSILNPASKATEEIAPAHYQHSIKEEERGGAYAESSTTNVHVIHQKYKEIGASHRWCRNIIKIIQDSSQMNLR